jgi:predicted DNA-binding transcriptional regulator AlpA
MKNITRKVLYATDVMHLLCISNSTLHRRIEKKKISKPYFDKNMRFWYENEIFPIDND